ncbi:MAG: DedA family protein [Acidimicrobiales bacterium]
MNLTDWVTRVIDAIGYLGVALLVALENLFPPIPSEVILPLAGFVAARGEAALVGMIIAATIGSTIGAWVLYLLAAWIGEERLHRLVGRYGRWFRVSEKDLENADAWFDRHAGLSVLVCRCIPLVRSLVSIPAGFRRMNPISFTIYTVLGSLVWNSALIGAGYLLGDRWHQVEAYVGWMQRAVLVLIAVTVAWFLWRRVIRPRRAGSTDPAQPQTAGSSQGPSGSQ